MILNWFANNKLETFNSVRTNKENVLYQRVKGIFVFFLLYW